MKKVAILIHAHRDPDLLARLVSRLRHPLVDIYINVDAKSDIRAFELVIKDVTFIQNRVNVVWGQFSQVQQILNSYQEIYDTATEYTHILFISGQDYPIQNINNIVSELQKNEDHSYLDYHPLANEPWFLLMKKRYQYWYFLPETDIRSNVYVKKVLTKLGFKRKYPLRNPVYYGSCWMCLSTEAIGYVLDYTKNNPSFVKFNKHTGCADELYFQSILGHSHLKSKLINNIHRYIDWSAMDNRPKDLTIDDLDKIKQSDAWFARKINLDIDPTLPDELDKLIGYN